MLHKNTAQFVPLGVLAIIGLVAVVGVFWQPYDANAIELKHRLNPPSIDHWLGTDEFGRDNLSRVLSGAAPSLGLGIGAVFFGLCIALPLALFSGAAKRRSNAITIHIMDVLISLPSIILALLIVFILGPGYLNCIIAIGLSAAPSYFRVLHAVVLDEAAKPYVLAATLRNERGGYVMFHEILPNILPFVLVELSIGIGNAMLFGAALSYLGLGVQPPHTDWGTMVRHAVDTMTLSAWPLVGPAVMLSITVMAFNFLGDAMRNKLLIRAW